MPIGIAVAAGLVPWLVSHGLAGLSEPPLYIAMGLLFSGVYLWRRSLYPGMVLHALLDLAVLAL